MTGPACDVLIRNGQVLTIDAARTIYALGAIAVSGGRIVEVGSDAELAARFSATTVIEADGGVVHPGFIDAHKITSSIPVAAVFSRASTTQNRHPSSSRTGRPE